jgi:hypothetical protein
LRERAGGRADREAGMSDALPLEQAGGAWRPMGHSQPRPKWDYEFTLKKVYFTFMDYPRSLVFLELENRVNHRYQLLKLFILPP